MKIKSVLSKIRSSSKLIDRFKINEEVADTESRSLFQDFIQSYNEVVGSINEYNSLKDKLKLKEKELKKSVNKLSKVRKSAKKTLKSSSKSPVKISSKAEGVTSELRNKVRTTTAIKSAKKTLRGSSRTHVKPVSVTDKSTSLTHPD